MASDAEAIRELMREGFGHAFQAQIGHLYKTYMSNITSVEEQAAYTKKGIENAVAAYRLALSAVESWEG